MTPKDPMDNMLFDQCRKIAEAYGLKRASTGNLLCRLTREEAMEVREELAGGELFAAQEGIPLEVWKEGRKNPYKAKAEEKVEAARKAMRKIGASEAQIEELTVRQL